MSNEKYTFTEVTDLDMHVDFSIGDSGDLQSGAYKRELFIIYDGPAMSENKALFFKQLQEYIEKPTMMKHQWVHTSHHGLICSACDEFMAVDGRNKDYICNGSQSWQLSNGNNCK